MESREFLCKSTLSVCGHDLDPEAVTAALAIIPDRASKRGERLFARNKDGTFDYSRPTPYRLSKGSWHKRIDKALWTEFVPAHLAHWCELLRTHEQSIRQWLLADVKIDISFYIDWGPVDFAVAAETMKVFSDFNIELRFAVWPPECFTTDPLTDEEINKFEEQEW